jgi:hypothetical protein
MTEENAGSGPDPESHGEPDLGPAAEITDPAEVAGLLSDMRRLRRDARSARHAYWFPLVLFGLLTCAAIPFYVLPRVPQGAGGGFAPAAPYTPVLGGSAGFVVHNYLGYYWIVALLGGLTLTLLWYRRHARRIGLKTPARSYLITVGVLTGLALVLPILGAIFRWSFVFKMLPGDLTLRGTFPFLIIAAGIGVLAWAERSRALAGIAVVYAGAALLASLYNIGNVLFRLGWDPSPSQWRLTGLPNIVLPALVLLVAGSAAFLVQRRQRIPA